MGAAADFTYVTIQGWGLYYPSTVLDDYSRYILVCPPQRSGLEETHPHYGNHGRPGNA
jgi:transposase InsO family protein